MAKKISLFYLLVGIAWVLLCSWALHEMALHFKWSGQQVAMLQNLKGVVIVVTTSILLFGVLHRYNKSRQKTELQYRSLFDENPNPMWVFDSETLQFLDVNRATIVEYGYTREELLQITIKDIRPPESLLALQQRLNEDIESYSKSGIWCHRRKNGDLFYVRIYSNAINYQGRPARLVMAFDISAIIHAEQKNKVLTTSLAKKERYLRSLIESQTTFLIRTDTKGRYSFGNLSYCRKLGYTSENIIGELFINDINAEEQINFNEIITNCLQHPGRVVPTRIKLNRKNKLGSTIITEWEFVAIQEVNSKITELQGVGQDVTEKVESEVKINEYSNRINDILESITDGFFAIDKNWNLTYVNKEFERILHCKREEVMGAMLWEVFPEATSLRFHTEFTKAIHEQVKVQFEEYYPKFGIWFKVSAYPATDGLTVYFQDITQEKLAQEKDFEVTQNLNALINNPSALIWSVNNKFELISANEPFLAQMDTVLGRRIAKGEYVLTPEFGEETINKWLDFYHRALKGEVYTVEDISYLPHNKVLYAEISFNPIRDREGNITGTGCFSRDITETKLHQIRIQDQNERLKEIAWIQSHEVRVPVANILGLLNAFNYKDLNDPFNLEVLAYLNVVTQNLDSIIRNIVNKTNEINDHSDLNSSLKLMPGDRIDTRNLPAGSNTST